MILVTCLKCATTSTLDRPLEPGDFIICFVCGNVDPTKYEIIDESSSDDYDRAMKGV